MDSPVVEAAAGEEAEVAEAGNSTLLKTCPLATVWVLMNSKYSPFLFRTHGLSMFIFPIRGVILYPSLQSLLRQSNFGHKGLEVAYVSMGYELSMVGS